LSSIALSMPAVAPFFRGLPLIITIFISSPYFFATPAVYFLSINILYTLYNMFAKKSIIVKKFPVPF